MPDSCEASVSQERLRLQINLRALALHCSHSATLYLMKAQSVAERTRYQLGDAGQKTHDSRNTAQCTGTQDKHIVTHNRTDWPLGPAQRCKGFESDAALPILALVF